MVSTHTKSVLLFLFLAVPITAWAQPNNAITRPGALSAQQSQMRLKLSNGKLKGLHIPMQSYVTSDHIGALNGEGHGVFEPGGDYVISGKGFGHSGQAILQVAGRQFTLVKNGWSDDALYVHLQDDISGLADGPATLIVIPTGKARMTSQAHRFRAAREDRVLTLAPDMVSSEARLGGVDPTVPPTSSVWDGKQLVIHREVWDQSDKAKRCFSPGVDRIQFAQKLKPGFEITGGSFFAEDLIKDKDNDPRGSYSWRWDGDDFVVTYGVQRWHTSRFVAIPAAGKCTSGYRVSLIVTGPRGISPL